MLDSLVTDLHMQHANPGFFCRSTAIRCTKKSEIPKIKKSKKTNGNSLNIQVKINHWFAGLNVQQIYLKTFKVGTKEKSLILRAGLWYSGLIKNFW